MSKHVSIAPLFGLLATLLVGMPAPASAAEDATGCVTVVTLNGGRSFKNTCPFSIEIAWCYVGKDCRHGSWGYTNTWTFGAGSVRSASTFASNLAGSTLKYGACKGANSRIEEVSATRHVCHS